MTTRLTWNKKTTDLVKELHTANMVIGHEHANSKAALDGIAKAVVAAVEHKGMVPSHHSIRSKLSNAGVYVKMEDTTKPANPDKTPVITKSDLTDKLAKHLGVCPSIKLVTLSNGNRADLEVVVKRAAVLEQNQVQNASKEVLQAALEALQDAEIDAIAGGADIADIEAVEQATDELLS